jgi:hypothetical protein
MDVLRRYSLLATAGLLGIALMLGWWSERPAVSANAANALSSAASYFDSTIVLARDARPVGWRGDELAIALGYLERLRLGVGSPFRLADDAANDPRLGDAMRSRVIWALIERLRRGDAYVVDASVLDGAGPWTAGHGATGTAHLALIERAIHTASDPRAGELAVRLAYLIESSKSSLSASAAAVATEIAAQVRDRELAVDDARDLLADANDTHADVLQVLEARRAQHAFRVEQPPLAPLSATLQLEAMNAVPALVAALDTLDRVVAAPPARPSAGASVLGHAFAERLAVLAKSQPPVAQVVVTLGTHTWAGFTATNEESLVAAYASAAQRADSLRRPAALALLATMVSVRSLAQQVPWFSGQSGPSVGDLTAEFGIAGVTFARAVPAAWQSYYLGELQTALRDVQSVFPLFSPGGLRVRFGVEALPDSALAMHDPRTRTIQLSISTSGGTLAHELSHDMDFQASRRLFAGAGGYSTDRSATEPRGALARSMRGLAEARLLRPAPPGSAPSTDRPAELFARGSDWFVASTLAQRGQSNGYLSAIEDELLPGYAAGFPTAVGNSGAEALTSAINAVTYLPDSLRAAFESQWSDARVIDPVLLVRRALETPVSQRGTRMPTASRQGMAPAWFAAPSRLCVADQSTGGQARERLLNLAVDARADGMARRRAIFRPTGHRGDWVNGFRGVAPWSPEPARRMIDGLRSSIVAALSAAVADQGVLPVIPAIFRSSDANCSSISR